MPDSSVGVYTRPPSPLPVTGQTADAPQVNVPVDDIAAALNRRSFRDGRAPYLGDQKFNGYRATGAGNAVDAQDLVTLSQVQALIAAVAGVPTGALIPLTGSVVPASWVVANGQTLVRATFPDFWAWVQASGNLAATEVAKTVGQYGPGNGSTTFTVPNLYADNGYFIRPISSGRTIGTVQTDELKSHTHSGTTTNNGNHVHRTGRQDNLAGGGSGSLLRPFGQGSDEDTGAAGAHAHDLNIVSTGGTETRPKNIAYPVIIKT